jgi:hypothetical protein
MSSGGLTVPDTINAKTAAAAFDLRTIISRR